MTGPDNLLRWIQGELEREIKADLGPALRAQADKILQAGVDGIRKAIGSPDAVAKARELVAQAVGQARRILRF